MRFEKGKGVFLSGFRPPSIRTVRTAEMRCGTARQGGGAAPSLLHPFNNELARRCIVWNLLNAALPIVSKMAISTAKPNSVVVSDDSPARFCS